MEKLENMKVYVDVIARFSKDGQMLPVSFIWEDDHRYEIDRIIKCERAASRKAGGAGLRYTCMVEGRQCNIFYEENCRWFLERRRAS